MGAKEDSLNYFKTAHNPPEGKLLKEHYFNLMEALSGHRPGILAVFKQLQVHVQAMRDLPESERPNGWEGALFCAICLADYFESGEKDLLKSFGLNPMRGAPRKRPVGYEVRVAIFMHRQYKELRKFEAAALATMEKFGLTRSEVTRYYAECKKPMAPDANGITISTVEFFDKLMK